MVNVIPVFRRVDAVYLDEDAGEIFRMPVLGIWWDEKDDPQLFDSDAFGCLDVPHTSGGFIGYEFDGIQQDWAKRIDSVKRKLNSVK